MSANDPIADMHRTCFTHVFCSQSGASKRRPHVRFNVEKIENVLASRKTGRQRSLPSHASGDALEWASVVASNPAAIKRAGLRNDRLTINRACIKRCGIESDVVAQHREVRSRIAITPADAGQDDAADYDVPIRRRTFPFAKRATSGRAEHARRDGIWREIIAWWVAGLKCADARMRVGDDKPTMLDTDMSGARFGDRRSREVPHTTLSRKDWVWFWSHAARRFANMRCIQGRTRKNRTYRRSSNVSSHGDCAAIPRGRRIGIARHIAANAAAPDSKRPFSLAWNRASSSDGSIGQEDSGALVTSINSIALRRSSRRMRAISLLHSGQPPSCQTISLIIRLI